MPHRFALGQYRWQRYLRVVNLCQIAAGNASALGIHPIQMRQLCRQKCGLQLVQPGIVSLINVVILVI